MYNKQIEKYAMLVIEGINDIRSKRDIKNGISKIVHYMGDVVSNTKTEDEINYIIRFIDELNIQWKIALETGRADEKVDELCQEWKDALSKKMCDALLDELDNDYDQNLINNISMLLEQVKEATSSSPVNSEDLSIFASRLIELEDFVAMNAGKKMSQEQANIFLQEIEEQEVAIKRIFAIIDQISSIGGLGL